MAAGAVFVLTRTIRSAGASARPAGKAIGCRFLSVSAARRLSPLMNLSGLAQSRESQYLSKERGIPRTEFSSALELIRSSEVDPFAPVAGASPTVVAALRRAQKGESDMQTAYSLAIANLLEQLEVSRRDNRQLTGSLLRLRKEHDKAAMAAVVMFMTIAGLTSYTLFVGDVGEALGRFTGRVRKEWREFDLQWLGNPPQYRTRSLKGAASTSPSTTSDNSSALQNSSTSRTVDRQTQTEHAQEQLHVFKPGPSISAPKRQPIGVEDMGQKKAEILQPSQSWLARLLWAPGTNL